MVQVAFPDYTDDQPAQSQSSLLSGERSDHTEALPEKGRLHDTEFFLKSTFEDNPSKGCALLFRRYHKALCNHAVRFVYSKEIAEDLVADVFCKFWKTKAYESIATSYRLYLFRSVRNEAINYLRWEFKETEEIEQAIQRESSLGHQPDHATQYEEVCRKVEELVETLPPQCQKVFLLSRFEGKKYQEIADELSISIKTVEVHLGKALGIMRTGLKMYL